MSSAKVQHPDFKPADEDMTNMKSPIENIQTIDQPDVSLESKDEFDDERLFTCDFCGKVLSCATSLTRHMRTAKYCLNERAEKCNKLWRCHYCNYETSVHFNFQRHLKSCSDKYKRAVAQVDKSREIELRTEIRILREQMEELKREAFRPRVTNISNTQNNLNLQIEHSKKVLAPYSVLQKDFDKILWAHYQMPQFRKGLKGVCSVINERILEHDGRKWLISYTPADYTFHRKGKEEAIEIDEKAEMMLKDLMPTIQTLARHHYDEAMETVSDECKYNIAATFREIRNIAIDGSNEHKECVQSIALQQCVSEPCDQSNAQL